MFRTGMSLYIYILLRENKNHDWKEKPFDNNFWRGGPILVILFIFIRVAFIQAMFVIW
jgi:hypothetical protein